MSSLRLAIKLSLDTETRPPSPSSIEKLKKQIPALAPEEGTKVEQKPATTSKRISSPTSVSSMQKAPLKVEEKTGKTKPGGAFSTANATSMNGCPRRLAIESPLEDSKLSSRRIEGKEEDMPVRVVSAEIVPGRPDDASDGVAAMNGKDKSATTRQPDISSLVHVKSSPATSKIKVLVGSSELPSPGAPNGVVTPKEGKPVNTANQHACYPTSPSTTCASSIPKLKPKGEGRPATATSTTAKPNNVYSLTSASVTPTRKIIKPSSTQNRTVSALSTPMLYVGITLEKPETLNSWGLVFTKEKTSHALIVRVIDPPYLTPNGVAVETRPLVKWCQITNHAPNPSVVYRTTMTSIIMPQDKYESHIAHNFPPSCKDEGLQRAGLLVPYLNAGDAILSVNGIPVSAFPNTAKFASYIRSNCQMKMVIVALRHEHVWAAALGQMLVRPGGSHQGNYSVNNNNQAATDRVSKAVREAWKRVLTPPTGGSHHQAVKRKMSSNPTPAKRPKIAYTNSKFKDEKGNPIKYCDNEDSHPDCETRIYGFVNNEIEKSFHQWLKKRKTTWRERRPRKYVNPTIETIKGEREEDVLTVQHDFWEANGNESFDQWLSASKSKWTRSFSWHKEKKEAVKSECEREVHFPMVVTTTVENHTLIINQFEDWLGVRKKQWRLERRKRHRQRVEIPEVLTENENACLAGGGGGASSAICSANDPNPCASNSNNQSMYYDEILEDEERLTEKEISQPMDISWVFDSQHGAPDDVIYNLMAFLCPSDHGNLLCLSYTTNFLFKQRDVMWRSLCPNHWILPRRPRKSWCVMYITKIRAEEVASRKRSDDLLVKANVIIEKGDQLNKLEKLIRKATKDFEFSVDYISCVVLERNSLLNLAVIDKRHKITKWLIEVKEADIETCDRGQFTPLLNAAWNGDKYIVRYLLGKGCDRTKVGYNHSSQGLAPATFEGLNAEGWARKRGHDDVAELIRLGL